MNDNGLMRSAVELSKLSYLLPDSQKLERKHESGRQRMTVDDGLRQRVYVPWEKERSNMSNDQTG